MDLDWLIAVVLAALSAFISNLGVTLQKLHHINDKDKTSSSTSPKSLPPKRSPKSHKHNHISSEEKASLSPRQTDEEIVQVDVDDDLEHDEQPSPPLSPSNHYTSSFTWRIGLAFVIFGSLFDLAALRFGPQSLVAPLGSLTLVSNICFARLLLREKVEFHDMVATGLIIAGSTLAVAFGKHGQPDFTAAQLFASFLRADFIIYACCIIAAAWTLYVKVRAIEKLEVDYGIDSDEYRPFRAAHRFAYPSLAGIIGAQSVLFAKCSIELIFAKEEVESDSSDSGDSSAPGESAGPAMVSAYGTALLNPITYVVIAIMFISIFLQIKFLNDGLKRFSSTYSIPVFQAFWIVVSVVSGMIFYEEYRGLTATHIGMFCFGVLISVTGVAMLTSRDHSHGQIAIPTEDDDENIEIEMQHVDDGQDSNTTRRISSSDLHESKEPAYTLGSVSAANLKAILNAEGVTSRSVSVSASNESSSHSRSLELGDSDDEELVHYEEKKQILSNAVPSDGMSIIGRG